MLWAENARPVEMISIQRKAEEGKKNKDKPKGQKAKRPKKTQKTPIEKDKLTFTPINKAGNKFGKESKIIDMVQAAQNVGHKVLHCLGNHSKSNELHRVDVFDVAAKLSPLLSDPTHKLSSLAPGDFFQRPWWAQAGEQDMVGPVEQALVGHASTHLSLSLAQASKQQQHHLTAPPPSPGPSIWDLHMARCMLAPERVLGNAAKADTVTAQTDTETIIPI